eukprot:jgi/Chlat1/4483/Chrsp29S04574
MDNNSAFLQKLLAAHPHKFGAVLDDPERFRFQLLLSEVRHNFSRSRPQLLRHGYRVDSEYFYPASTIKLCAAIAALHELQALGRKFGAEVSVTTPITLHPLNVDDAQKEGDDGEKGPSNVPHAFTIAEDLRKLFLVSDNIAYNHLYSFAGQRLDTTRIRGRLQVVRSAEFNHMSPAIEIHATSGAFCLPPRQCELDLGDNRSIPGYLVGQAHIDQGSKVDEPLDMSMKSRISLQDLQDTLVKLLRPDIESVGDKCFQLNEGQVAFLREAMVQFPAQSSFPAFNAKDYPDDYCKFLLPGLGRVKDKRAIRIYNKIGRAYGFTIENAFVVDMETGCSFFLTATLYTNSNGVMNDDKYEYEPFADNFFADLGEVAARCLWQIPPFQHLGATSLDAAMVEPSASMLDFTPTTPVEDAAVASTHPQHDEESSASVTRRAHPSAQPPPLRRSGARVRPSQLPVVRATMPQLLLARSAQQYWLCM